MAKAKRQRAEGSVPPRLTLPEELHLLADVLEEMGPAVAFRLVVLYAGGDTLEFTLDGPDDPLERALLGRNPRAPRN